MSASFEGTLHDHKRNALPSCFATPDEPVLTLSHALPSSLKLLGSLTYRGPKPRAVALLRSFKGGIPKIIASEPPSDCLPPSLFRDQTGDSSGFPVLHAGLPLHLNHSDTTYSIQFYFCGDTSLFAGHYSNEPYSIRLHSERSAKPCTFLPSPSPPYSVLSFTSSFINLERDSHFIVCIVTPGTDLTPFYYVIDFCDGTRSAQVETLRDHLLFSPGDCKTIRRVEFQERPSIFRFTKR